MRIAVLGAGNVGGTLGRRWAERGHDVTFGVRRPEEGAAAVEGGDTLPARARVAAIAEAVRGADAVLLATPWGAVADALRAAGVDRGALDGVVLLDATNPLAAGLALDISPNGASGAERVQALAPRARVVKAFNTTGAENMANPLYDGVPAVMFYAGDDAAAKAVARELVSAVGFEPVDAGALVRARQLEHLALLWISLAFGAAGAPALGRRFALRLVRR
jgi:predicted dinucleotide-binding enzyme